jgi:hypothetical protein
MPFGHHHGGFFHHGYRHGLGGRALAGHVFEFILVGVAALIVATVARYATLRWFETRRGDDRQASAVGWIVFLLALFVVGVLGLKLL